MTATVTDLFCGAGGSSLGAHAAGLELVMAANHWSTAIDVHQAHFPDAAHDCADITQVDPRRYPRTDILIASPECTNHSQARGVSRKRQDPTFWDAPDPAAERSRATMWDVCRFAEQMDYDAIVVENVVEATKWVGWRGWSQTMADLGYERRILSQNSMHHGVPQSRDRIYVVFWRRGLRPDLELEHTGWCPRCAGDRACRQAWKNERTVGRYRQQWRWSCTTCGATVDPGTRPAADIIDWGLDCPRIGDRRRPLAAATRARILAGLQRYGWAPVVTAGAGHVYETTPGNRARPLTDPLPVQATTAQHALATPPAFVVPMRSGRNRSHGVDEPMATVVAGGNYGALVLANNHENVPQPVDRSLSTVTTGNRHALVVPLRRHGHAQDTDQPVPTVTAGGTHHGLLMRNNGGGAEMVTPTDEPARTVTTKGHQSLLMPYYGRGQAHPTDRPVPTVPTRDHFALVDPDQVVDDCGFRMLEPHEIAAAMAFPDGYIPAGLTKRDRVKLAGNAVTPPVMQWITGRLLQALEGGGVIPYFDDGRVALYHGDSREVLPLLDMTSVGVVAADPPYGETSLTWDRWQPGWVGAVADAVRQTCTLWCFGSMRMFLDHADDFTGWRLAQDLVWEKHNGSSSAADRFKRVHEHVLQWYRGDWAQVWRTPVTTPDATKREVRRKRRPPQWGDIGAATYRSADGGPRLARSVLKVRSCHGHAQHPTQKPLGIIDPLLRYSLAPGGMVLDPFAGAGSTLVAAREAGYRAIGIEADERYCEIAARRMAQGALDFGQPEAAS